LIIDIFQNTKFVIRFKRYYYWSTLSFNVEVLTYDIEVRLFSFTNIKNLSKVKARMSETGQIIYWFW